MNELKRKPDDEMLVTHKPVPDPAKAGREARELALREALADADFGRLRQIVTEAADEEERRDFLEEIQLRFGAEVADGMLRPSPPSAGEGPSDDNAGGEET